MSRSGYVDEHEDNWALIKWRGRVASALRGKRGQQFLRDLIAALDAMPVKELAPGKVAAAEGCVCAMGEVARHRQIDMTDLQEQLDDDSDDPEYVTLTVAHRLNIAGPLAQEIAYLNDEAAPHNETPAERWARMRRWAERNLK